MKKNAICAVIVTYNRKHLLLRCIHAILNQSINIDKIFIIDNASTDGTYDYLVENSLITYFKISYINLKENQGGAGGFHEGIKIAYQKGYDYIWLMDDDGYPDNDCLYYLNKYKSSDICLGTMVIDEKLKKELCFPMRIPNSIRLISNINDLANEKNELLEDIIIPFNGVLLPKELVSKIGYPRKEYFIWGDDIEYILRLQKNNIKIATVTKARFYHPKDEKLGSKMFFGKLKFNDTDSKVKLYCMCRNNTVNLIEYKGFLYFLLFYLKVNWFYLFSHFNLQKLSLSYKAIIAGLKKDFSKHHNFL